MLTYGELSICLRKGLRNGNWRKLGLMEKIFYRAAFWYAKVKRKIINNRIVARLNCIAKRLETTISKKILLAGLERVRVIFTKFEENGVFKWAPKLKTWLKDSEYVFWLGLNSQPPYGNWTIQSTGNNAER